MTARLDPIRLFREPAGYTIYGSEAKAAGAILGREPAYRPGDFTGYIAVADAELAAALAGLIGAGETVLVLGDN